MWKEEDSCTESEDEASDEGADGAEDEPLFGSSARTKTSDEHRGDRRRDSGPRDGLIDDVAKRGAEAQLECKGEGLGLLKGSRNKKRNSVGGQGNELLVGGGDPDRHGND